jgi:hypothetical protein
VENAYKILFGKSEVTGPRWGCNTEMDVGESADCMHVVYGKDWDRWQVIVDTLKVIRIA